MAQGQAGTILQHLRKLMHAETQGLTDAQLLQRFASRRDEAAFTALMARHGPLVLALCRRILHHAQDAEDAFQATFLVLARMAGSIRKGEAVGSWLYGVAYRVAMKASKAAGRRRELERRMQNMPRREQADDRAQGAAVSLGDLQRILDEEVHRLPPKYRDPFVLCCLECKSRAEAAQDLGWKPGTLASRLAHAKRVLQQRLTRRGVTLTAALAALALSTQETLALPAPLTDAALKAALLFAARQTATSVSGHAVILAKSTLRAMFLTRLQGMAMLVAALLLPAATGLLALQAFSPQAERAPLVGPDAQAPGLTRPGAPTEVRSDRYGDPLPDGAVRRFGTLRLRQSGTATFTHDGKHVVTSGGDTGSHLVFWDRQTGKETRRLKADFAIRRLQFSPNGKILAAALGVEGANLVWDVDSGDVLFRFKGEEGIFTPDGRTLLGVYSGQDGPTVGAWDVAAGKQTGEWTMPEKARGVYCSPDGKTVAYSLDDALVLHDLATGKELRRLADTRSRQGPGSGQSFTFSPDGKRVAATSLRGLRVWNVATGSEEYAWNRLVDSPVCFSADGKQIAWTGHDERSAAYPWMVALGDAKGPSEPRRLGLPINNLHSQLAFSRDAATLAVVGDAGAVELRDVATGKDALPFDANAGRIFGLQLSPDGRYLATSDTFRVLVWDKATGKLRRRFPEDGPVAGNQSFTVWDVRLAADGTLQRGQDNNTHGHWFDLGEAAVAKLQKLGLKDGKKLAFASFEGGIRDVLESPGGRYVAVSVTPDPPGTFGRIRSMIRVWDARTGQPLAHVLPPAIVAAKSAGAPHLGAFSPDNRVLVTTSATGSIHLWDLATGQERLSFQGHLACSVRSVLFTPDSRYLFTGGDDSQVLQWDLTGRALDGEWRTVQHDAKARLDLWTYLASSDAAKAHKAQWALAADPEGSAAFLKDRLKPAAAANEKETAELIADLASDTFAARQQAEAKLVAMGEAAAPAMRRALTERPSLEQARRLEKLLEGMSFPSLTGDSLRAFRAIEVLERIATPAAQHVLGNLAGGIPDALFTQAAKDASLRLGVR